MNRRAAPKDPHVPSSEGIYLETMDTPKLNRVGGGGGGTLRRDEDTTAPTRPHHQTIRVLDSKSSRPTRSHVEGDHKTKPYTSNHRGGDGTTRRSTRHRNDSKRRVRSASSFSSESSISSKPSSDHRLRRGSGRKSSRHADKKHQRNVTSKEHNRRSNMLTTNDSTTTALPSVGGSKTNPHTHNRPPTPFMPFGVPPPPEGMDPLTFQSMLLNMPTPTYTQHPPYAATTTTTADAQYPQRASLSQPAVSRSQSLAKSQGSALERLANVEPEVGRTADPAYRHILSMHPSAQYWSQLYSSHNNPQHPYTNPDLAGVHPWQQLQLLLAAGHPLPFVPPHPTGYPPPPTTPLPGAFAPIDAARWSSSSPSPSSSFTSSSGSSSSSWSSSSPSTPPQRKYSHINRRDHRRDTDQRSRRRNSQAEPAQRAPREHNRLRESKTHSARSSRACTPRATQTEDVPPDSRIQSRVSSMPNSRASSCSRQQEHRLRRVAQKAASHGSDAFGPSSSSGYFEQGTDVRRWSSTEAAVNRKIEATTPPTSTTTPPSPPVAVPIPFMHFQHSQFFDPTVLDVRRRAELYKWSGDSHDQDDTGEYNSHNQYSTTHKLQHLPRSMQDTVSSSMRFGKSSYARFKHERDRQYDDGVEGREYRRESGILVSEINKEVGHRPMSVGVRTRPSSNGAPVTQNRGNRALGERGAVTRSELKGTPPPLSHALRRSFVVTPNSTTTTPMRSSAQRPKKRPPWIAPNSPGGNVVTSRTNTPKSPRSPRTRSGYNLREDHHNRPAVSTITSPNPSPVRNGRSDLQQRIKKSEERADQQANDMESLYRKLRQNYERYHDDPEKFLASFEETHRNLKQVSGGNGTHSMVKSPQSTRNTYSPTQYTTAQNHHHHQDATILQRPERSTATDSSRLRAELSELEQQWSAMRGLSAASGGLRGMNPPTTSQVGNMKGLHEPDDYEVHPSSSPPRPSSPTRHRHDDDITASHTPRTASRLQHLSSQEGVLALIRDRRNQQQQQQSAASTYSSYTSHRDGFSRQLSSAVAHQHPYRSLSPLATAPITTVGNGSHYSGGVA